MLSLCLSNNYVLTKCLIQYVFLEVNPEVQVGMVSYPCNYYLEKKLAEELIKSHKKNVDKEINS